MSWQSSAEQWKQLPRRSSTLFASGVFGLFASLGFIIGGRSNPISNLCFALFNGFCAVVWAIAGTRKLIRVMAILLPVQLVVNALLSLAFNKVTALSAPFASTLEQNAEVNAAIAIALILAGYALFLSFFRAEAGRYFATVTEMRLAGEIHRNLVPEIRIVDRPFEFYGRSWPSGEVGGDLVDVIRSGWGWLAYVADVSGHGVPAGVLMTMMKSAARARLSAVGPEHFLPAMNDVLLPLSEPNMYVTIAFLCYSAGVLQFATAGHPPILHYCHASRQVVERANENFPVALLRDAAFEVSQLPVEPGDVLVILTDGLTEVTDRADRELGLAPLKALLAQSASAPLSALAEKLRTHALEHGKQTDDQSLLIVRPNADSGLQTALPARA